MNETNLLVYLIFAVCAALSFLLSGMEAGVFALSRLRIRRQMRTGKVSARVLHGLLENRRATCHPFFSNKPGGLNAVEEPVVVDGNCITSRGAGTAVEFALNLVAILYSPEKAAAVAGPMLAQFELAG